MTLTHTSLYAEVRALAKAIQAGPLSKEKYRLLSSRLDGVLSTVQELEAARSTAHIFLAHLREWIVPLYRALEEGRVQDEMAHIQSKSLSLRSGRITKKAYLSLKARVAELEAHYAGSVAERRVLAEAKETLAKVSAQLGKEDEWMPPLAPRTQAVETLLASLLPGEVEELFSIAEALFFEKNLPAAKQRYQALPTERRGRVEEHLAALGEPRPFEAVTPFIQALIATANELVGNQEGYPSPAQVSTLFHTLESDAPPSPRKSKIISFTLTANATSE
jgi:hypothetical protein